MTSTALPRRILSFGILAVLTPFCLLAEPQATPEPKVTATIAQSPGKPASCIAILEVRHPETDEILSAPKFALAAGQEASTTTSDADMKIEVSIKTASACAGGTYDVRVLTKGSLT